MTPELKHWRLEAVKERLQGKRGWANTMAKTLTQLEAMEEAAENFKRATENFKRAMETMQESCPPKSRGDKKMAAQQARLMTKLVHQEFRTRSRQ